MQEQKIATNQFSLPELFSVEGYRCLVTGGGTGIGLMMAQALASNGAKVYITGRDMKKLETSAKEHATSGTQIIPIGPCDVSDKDSLEKLYKEFCTKEDHLDLLIANAGIAGPKGDPAGSASGQELKEKLWHEKVEDWSEVFKVDVSSIYFTTLAFLPLLSKTIEKKGDLSASVITTTSMSGMMKHAQGHFAYNAAKAAAIHLTKMMSAEFKETHIRINSIAPGYFPSEMTAKESDEKNKSSLPAENVQKKGHVPSQRPGSDREMASATIFLATNTYTRGQIIALDGGVLDVVAS